MYSLFELILTAVITSITLSCLLFCYSARRHRKVLLKGEKNRVVKGAGEDVAVAELLNNIESGIFIRVPGENRYLYFNKKARELCNGMDGTEPGGISRVLCNLNTDPESVEKEDERILISGEPFRTERVAYDAQGVPKNWIQVNKQRITSVNGHPLILGTMVDVTAAKLQKTALENIKTELQMALEAGGVEAWVYHVQDGSVTDFHNGEDSLREQVFYVEARAALLQEDYIRLDTGFQSILKKEEPFFRSVFRKKQGEEAPVKYYECRMKGVCSEHSGELDFIIGVQKDITQEILWKKAIDDNQLKINLAIKAARMVLWEYDAVEDKFSSQDPQSIVYNPIAFKDYFSLMHPEDVEPTKIIFREVMSDTAQCNEADVRVLMPDGEYRWVHLQGSVSERDHTGKPVKMVGIRRDIDTEKQLNRQLVELKEEAERSSKLKSAYLANMSHEIRTPLNAIVGFSNLMMYTDEPTEREEYNRIIQTNNELLLQLINDILDLSKIEAGFLTFNYEDEDISDLFGQLEQAFVSKVNKGVELRVQIPDKKCVIHIDRNRFMQIVTNFLTNACKFTAQGYVEFGYKRTEKGLAIYVTDTGIGMTKEQCETVFNRFTKYGHKIAGTGLGMAICETLVKMMGGTIGVNSVLGEGTTFWAEIPCEPLAYSGKTVKSPPKTLAMPRASGATE